MDGSESSQSYRCNPEAMVVINFDETNMVMKFDEGKKYLTNVLAAARRDRDRVGLGAGSVLVPACRPMLSSELLSLSWQVLVCRPRRKLWLCAFCCPSVGLCRPWWDRTSAVWVPHDLLGSCRHSLELSSASVASVSAWQLFAFGLPRRLLWPWLGASRRGCLVGPRCQLLLPWHQSLRRFAYSEARLWFQLRQATIRPGRQFCFDCDRKRGQ